MLSLQAYAQAVDQRQPPRLLVVTPNIIVAEQTAVIDRDTAAALVRSATGGRILGIRPARINGKTVYKVKVLLQGGRIRIVRVDAQTGRLMH